MRKSLFTLSLLALAFGGTTACATKGFVKSEVSQVSSKVDTLSQSLEETQERTKKNEAKIVEVDNKAGVAQGAADHAQMSANEADSHASAAGDAAKAAADKAAEVDKNSKRLLYTVILSEDEGGFKFNKTELPDEAKAKIDELVNQIKADPKGAYFEIEGHTDNVGDKDVNERVGLERAQAVARYLYEQHQIPLHRINVISYGEDKPVAPNTTKEGRAQNRRIVIKVLI
ncbi:MAG TPA: OmpA family protein [Vicinamibacterales bacterium]|nr:OmpA family protein [Vicinamibacterales bacterium]